MTSDVSVEDVLVPKPLDWVPVMGLLEDTDVSADDVEEIPAVESVGRVGCVGYESLEVLVVLSLVVPYVAVVDVSTV